MIPATSTAAGASAEGESTPGLARLRVLGWTVLFLLVAELALEVRAFRRGWEALLLAQDRGAARGVEEGFGPTDEFPFRSRAFSADAPPSEPRVWVASSSYGEALELPAEEIFPVRLGDALSAAVGAPVHVLNASTHGATVRTNVRALRALGPHWRPDVTVLYQLSNDFDRIVEAGWTTETLDLAEAAPATGGGGMGSRLDRLVEQTTLYKHLQTQVSSRLAAARPLRRRVTGEEVAVFRALVEAFVDESETLGARPVLATFAVAHPEPGTLPDGWARLLLRSNMDLGPSAWCDAVDRGNAVIRAVAAERDLPLADVAAALSGRAERFRDPWHFTPEGHAEAATVLAAAVREALERR